MHRITVGRFLTILSQKQLKHDKLSFAKVIDELDLDIPRPEDFSGNDTVYHSYVVLLLTNQQGSVI